MSTASPPRSVTVVQAVNGPVAATIGLGSGENWVLTVKDALVPGAAWAPPGTVTSAEAASRMIEAPVGFTCMWTISFEG
jgi:hypothetical protein